MGPILPLKPGLPGSPFMPLGPCIVGIAGMPVGQWEVESATVEGHGEKHPSTFPLAQSAQCGDFALLQLRQAQCSLTWLAFGSLQPIPAIPAWHTWDAWQAWSPIAVVWGVTGHCRFQTQK